MIKSHRIPILCHEHPHGENTNTLKRHEEKTNKNHGEKTNTLKAQQSFCSGVLAATRSFAMMNSLNQAVQKYQTFKRSFQSCCPNKVSNVP